MPKLVGHRPGSRPANVQQRVKTEYFTAKRKAAKRLGRSFKPADLPSNAEIREQIQVFARIHEGDQRTRHLREMRLDALRLMRLLRAFRPRLIGSVMTGHVRKGSDIDLHIFSDSATLVTDTLENEGYSFDLERKQVVKHNESRIFTHVHVRDRVPNFELTILRGRQSLTTSSKARSPARPSASRPPCQNWKSSWFGNTRASTSRPKMISQSEAVDPYQLFRLLLLPLENVEARSPRLLIQEGDALYHSLQVFELARDRRPYDEEFLLAALLHDVGKGLDPHDYSRRRRLSALDGPHHWKRRRNSSSPTTWMPWRSSRSSFAARDSRQRTGSFARYRGPTSLAARRSRPDSGRSSWHRQTGSKTAYGSWAEQPMAGTVSPAR